MQGAMPIGPRPPMMGCSVVPGMVAAGQHGGPRPPVSRIVFNKYDKDNSDSMDAAEFKFMCMDLGHEYSEEELAQAVREHRELQAAEAAAASGAGPSGPSAASSHGCVIDLRDDDSFFD